jgi:hypothetical protein
VFKDISRWHSEQISVKFFVSLPVLSGSFRILFASEIVARFYRNNFNFNVPVRYNTRHGLLLFAGVADPCHFGVDPDLNPRTHASN